MKIDELAKKVEEIEKEKDLQIDQLEKRLVQLESLFSKTVDKNPKNKISCNLCDFEANSKHGLKVHI